MKKKIGHNLGPVVLIANSSWYLFHYRSYLIKKLNDNNIKTILIAPKDEFTDQLCSLGDFVECNISRKNSLNIFPIIFSFIRLYKIINKLKPSVIHSHTLKPNFIISLISFFLGIKTILSFTGLGILSIKKGLSYLVLKLIIKFIYFFSTRELNKY